MDGSSQIAQADLSAGEAAEARMDNIKKAVQISHGDWTPHPSQLQQNLQQQKDKILILHYRIQTITTAITNMQRDKQSEIQELQKQNQYLLQNLNELTEHMVNLSRGLTMLQQKIITRSNSGTNNKTTSTKCSQAYNRQSLRHSSQTRAVVVLATTTAALGALQANQGL
jgi:hypothetical protein